jgi:hypothetical protein
MPTIKEKIGCWLHERWKTEIALSPRLSRLLNIRWTDLCNRHEQLAKGVGDSRICLWKESSFLTVARFFPHVGGRLMRHCLKEWPVSFVNPFESKRNLSDPRISIILPVGGKDRIRQFQYVLSAFFGQTSSHMEIIVVEHAEDQSFRELCPQSVKYIFLPRAGNQQFNKSLAMNTGVRNAKAPYVLLHDSDVIPPAAYIGEVLKRLDEGWDAFRPMLFLFLLGKAETDNIGSRSMDNLPAKIDLVHTNFPGVSSALKKDIYEMIGGHDEQFEGWGGEDSEFLDRLRTKHLFPGSYLPGLHLWHAASPKKATGDRNNDLMQRLSAIPVSDRIRLLNEAYNKKR